MTRMQWWSLYAVATSCHVVFFWWWRWVVLVMVVVVLVVGEFGGGGVAVAYVVRTRNMSWETDLTGLHSYVVMPQRPIAPPSTLIPHARDGSHRPASNGLRQSCHPPRNARTQVWVGGSLPTCTTCAAGTAGEPVVAVAHAPSHRGRETEAPYAATKLPPLPCDDLDFASA